MRYFTNRIIFGATAYWILLRGTGAECDFQLATANARDTASAANTLSSRNYDYAGAALPGCSFLLWWGLDLRGLVQDYLFRR